MKAVQFSRFGGPEVLDLVELADPHPGVGEVRIRVRAAGVNASDWKKRQGPLDQDLPQTMGYEASGIVDEIGDGVTGVAVGDHVFGASPYGAAQAEPAVLSAWAPVAGVLDDATSAAIPAAAETAARSLDQLGVRAGNILLVNGHVAQPAAAGRFVVRVDQTFPLAAVVDAHQIGESGRVRGKWMLLVG